MRFVVAALIGLLGACCIPIECRAASVAELRAVLDGAYVLEEWHIGATAFRPPQVDGRVVFLHGAVVFISINKTQEEQQVTAAGFGIYDLNATSFSYRYDNFSTFTQTATINVSHTLPWEGMRDFEVIQEGTTVRLRSRIPEQAEFVFNADGMRYWEGGKLLRVWRRSKSD
jgi:hypothetical protein